MDQPVEEKNEQCGNSNEESMADVNPPVKEETSETLMSEGNEAKNSYMLRHRGNFSSRSDSCLELAVNVVCTFTRR